jgi:exodeoxyribonuclease VII small subunit
MERHGKQKNTKAKSCKRFNINKENTNSNIPKEGETKMSKKEENKSFEELMEKLETIVQELEKGDLNLDDSVAKFEEGMKISKECNKILENSEKRISILLENDGELAEEDFNA